MKIRTRFVLSFLGLAIVLLGVSTFLIYLFSSNILFRNSQSQLLAITKTTSLLIDSNRHKNFSEPFEENSDAYLREIKKLREVLEQNPDIRSIYTLIEKGGEYFYILDVTATEEGSREKITQRHRLRQKEPQPDLDAILTLKDHRPRVNRSPSARSGYRFLSAYAPIKDLRENVIGVVGVELDVRGVDQLMGILLKRTLMAFTIAFLLALLVAVFFTNIFYKPFNLFFHATKRISKGDLNFRVHYDKDDEIKVLAHAFNQMINDLRVTKGQVENSARVLEQTVKERTQELKEVNLNLLQQKIQAESLLNSIGEGVFGFDGKGRIIFSNPVAEKLLGLRHQSILGKEIWQVLNHLNKSNEPFTKENNPLLNVMLTRTPRYCDNEYFTKSNGTPFPVQYIATPVRLSEKIRGSIVVFQDITKRRELDNLKDNFIATVSHELRTPLTSIIGNSSILLNDKEIPENKKETFVKIIEKQGKNLLALINDLLDISRLEAGKFQLKEERCNLEKVIDETLATTRVAAKEKAITIKRYWKTHKRLAYADPFRITQVLNNLINNALKFSPKGTKIEIFINESIENDGFFQISVKDEGVGIPKEKLPQLFQRFYQLDNRPTRKYGGSGLGLSIAKEIVELHGGRIWVKSKEGEGSEFFFTLPQKQVESLAVHKTKGQEEVVYH